MTKLTAILSLSLHYSASYLHVITISKLSQVTWLATAIPIFFKNHFALTILFEQDRNPCYVV